MARSGIEVHNNTSRNLNEFKINLTKAERKGLKKATKIVEKALQKNTPIGNELDNNKLVNNIIRKNPTEVDGILTAGVGYSNDGWYYVFTNSGVNNSSVVRKYATKQTSVSSTSSRKFAKTKPYRLYQPAQNYVGKTITETKQAVDGVIKNEIEKEVRRATS